MFEGVRADVLLAIVAERAWSSRSAVAPDGTSQAPASRPRIDVMAMVVPLGNRVTWARDRMRFSLLVWPVTADMRGRPRLSARQGPGAFGSRIDATRPGGQAKREDGQLDRREGGRRRTSARRPRTLLHAGLRISEGLKNRRCARNPVIAGFGHLGPDIADVRRDVRASEGARSVRERETERQRRYLQRPRVGDSDLALERHRSMER